ncbi:hypothetical protein D9Q98_008572 [Chlorella vulgaris]|uniref:Uncharacterized protein n=1 Tax=Chlorella vulgaris TaxID=3077 RepID=A0A9D4YU04_CHLVU|nr:hypothetical protein D9Q98_008572 [Chlorella vulgaris]
MSIVDAGPAEVEAGWPAIHKFGRWLLNGGKESEQPPLIPEALQEWPNTILPAVAAGFLYGMTNKWGDELKLLGPVTTVNKRVQRLFRVSDAALRTALPMGAMAALFIGVEAAFAVHRGRQNLMLDSTVGGAAVAAVYSAHRIANAPTWPPVGVGTSALITMALCASQGVLQHLFYKQKLAEREVEAEAAAELQRAAIAASRKSDLAVDLLSQLEARLTSVPAGSQAAAGAGLEEGQQEQAVQQQEGEEGTGLHGDKHDDRPEQQQQTDADNLAAQLGKSIASAMRRWCGLDPIK